MPAPLRGWRQVRTSPFYSSSLTDPRETAGTLDGPQAEVVGKDGQAEACTVQTAAEDHKILQGLPINYLSSGPGEAGSLCTNSRAKRTKYSTPE
jgi:hypothetical protein